MMKKHLCIGLVLCMLALAGCGTGSPAASAGSTVTTAPAQKQEQSVWLTNTAGQPLYDVTVKIFDSAARSSLIAYGTTDTAGALTFSAYPSASYVAVLEDLPAGYLSQTYPVTGTETRITVEAQLLPADAMDTMEQVRVGSVMCDFSYTDPEGQTVTLSQMLESKGVAVLNFWYIACQPCAMEFPYLDDFYARYGDRAAVIALSPSDTAQQVAAYRQEKGLSLPMSVCDPSLTALFGNIAYPTTVVINGDGVVTSIHTGSVSETEAFITMYETAVSG